MATEEGVVIRMGALGAGTAWVRTIRSSTCAACASRDNCHAGGPGKEMEVEAINTAAARVGDRIVLNIQTGALLKASFLLYVFPVLALIAGALVGQGAAPLVGWDASASAAAVGFLFFGAAFGILRIMDRHLSGKTAYKPEIVKIRGSLPPPDTLSLIRGE